MRSLGDVPWEDIESTLNLGVGMVAVVAPEAADATIAASRAAGIEAWELGTVHDAPERTPSGRVVAGTKGVDGGAVDIHGRYRA